MSKPDPRTRAFRQRVHRSDGGRHFPGWRLVRIRADAHQRFVAAPGGPCTALLQFLLRGLQGVSPRGWRHACLSHGPPYREAAPERAALVDRSRAEVPESPGSLYLRPLLFGTTANIGAAATPADQAMLVVLASPVWDYFAGGMKPLRILMEPAPRSAPHLGMVKTGGNYAAALGPTLAARRQHQTDQVLFCPNGEVQETGAANFLLLRDRQILTRSLDSTFLHGVTRDSLLTLAREMGYTVQERIVTVEETLDWVANGEAALSGTAAVLAGVGTLIWQDREVRVADGGVGPVTQALRAALVDVQRGATPDRFGWLTAV